ncbi:putative LRR receptor-like serine/threonine-protein kinase IRK [Vitis vinifera]|uniref:Putative LRR receptor-like serine/threonine-protein kinase IRK n=1 Tax=Vitis vinifera TaxID=29760 RepID=A0A438E426_VITVI|nr:putative LRR receptor-like serine/threonine-protein kinase IRK [Vitis vinifera]
MWIYLLTSSQEACPSSWPIFHTSSPSTFPTISSKVNYLLVAFSTPFPLPLSLAIHLFVALLRISLALLYFPSPLSLTPILPLTPLRVAFPRSLAHKKIILSISALIAIVAAAVIVIGVIAITVLNLRVRSSASRSAAALALSGGDDYSHSPTTDANSGKLVMFSGDPDFSMGAHALLNKDCELGRGGLEQSTGLFFEMVIQLPSRSLLSQVCLYKHLHEGAGGNFTWNERFNIILGTAKSLAHLHQMSIIHYNLKSSNVLIDPSGEPKVADFGLARLLPMLDRYVLSSKIQSALGYMAPEFACRTVKITEKCDVYGFGVLVLEVVTGKRPVEYMEDDVVVLCDMVRGALEEGKVEECVDGDSKENSQLRRQFCDEVRLNLHFTGAIKSARHGRGGKYIGTDQMPFRRSRGVDLSFN